MCVLAVSSCVLVVLVVFVSQSIVKGLGDNVFSDTDCEIVEPQSISLSGKRRALFFASQGGMSMEDVMFGGM